MRLSVFGVLGFSMGPSMAIGPTAGWEPGPGGAPPSNVLQDEEQPEEQEQGDGGWGRSDAGLTALAAEVLEQVAVLRELPVRAPVKARYADKATFLRYVEAMETHLQSPARRAAEPWVAKLLGWVPLDMDLRQAQRELLATQVGGFYDPVRKTFFVMEGLHPDLIRILMAHELGHALDDQYFDLQATDRRLADRTDALLAHHAVAEGSAQVVMTRWIAEHAKQLDQAALRDFQSQMDFGVLSRSPRYLWQPFFGLYAQGQAFLAGREGPAPLALADSAALQSAFENLPVSTEQILHPAKYWDATSRDLPVLIDHDVTGLAAGWKREFTDCLGELLVALCTQPRTQKLGPIALMGLEYTHKEASGWGGDRLSLLRSKTGRVLVWDLVWDRARDADEFWAGVSKQTQAVERLGQERLRLESDRIRWVAWLDTSREEALKVASQVGYSRRAWGKIPASPGAGGAGPGKAPGDPSGAPPGDAIDGHSGGESRSPGSRDLQSQQR